MVEELHALLAKAGERPPYILVGHSFGGFDALMFAHKYRAETAGVVLVAILGVIVVVAMAMIDAQAGGASGGSSY